MKFSLGRLVSTPGAIEAIAKSGESPLDFLKRHVAGDWGDVDADDRAENELSVKQGLRIFSAYTLKSGVKIWVITEADRSATTILLPEEY